MKEIGILTFQFADNYGAVLQCYALKHKIDLMKGYHANIINFVPTKFSYGKSWDNQYEYQFFENKRRKFNDFLKRNCELDNLVINSLSDMATYDCIVVGSDQIWNTTMLDYFLPEIYVKKVSYAASLGLELNNPNLRRKTLKKYIPKFESVSVREYEHVDFLKQLCNVECECTLDPTLLLDAIEYEVLVPEKKKENEFLFFFWLFHDQDYLHGVELANSVARKYNLKIVHNLNHAKSYTFHNDAGDMQYEGIEDFLWYIKNARFVVTNSYHACIFSILFETPFYVVPSLSMRCRFDTLDSRFHISDRIVNGYLPVKEINSNIDFYKIKEEIKKQRSTSEAFLKEALEK